MNNKKIKVMVLGDDPRHPSGVANQMRYFINGLLKTGRYSFVSIGGALKHASYDVVQSPEYGEDFIIYPTDGYGTHEMVRALLKKHKPDVMWIMTDPRYWEWLWTIENEIRPNCPIVYYHVWDNYPYPQYNRRHYLSNDKIVTISKLTDDIVRTVAPEVDCTYLPHTVDTDIFKPMSEADVLPHKPAGKTLFFWNNRNARRKLPGTVLWWFADFLDMVGKDKAMLLMHTDPRDPQQGIGLEAIAQERGLTRENYAISAGRVDEKQLALYYNIADCTINISDAEGFGIGTLESLACGTPIIINETGGLQDQITDGVNKFGIGIKPASKAIVGSQQTPYIYEDRVSREDFIDALMKIHNMTNADRKHLGALGRENVLKTFSMEQYVSEWDRILTEVHEKHGSWETRKNHSRWTLKGI
jgi:glycosyltransferase involved in cell wall biosynthesis